MECIMFETEDLVCRKNEKHVILTILDVARRGAKIGMLAPMLIQFEQEIDVEIARYIYNLPFLYINNDEINLDASHN